MARRGKSASSRAAAGASNADAASDAGSAAGGGDGAPAPDKPGEPLVRRHLAWGWWSLAVFATLGLLLEAAHGLKLGWYVDLTAATRRLSFTLAHTHGTLLGLVHIAFALSLGRVSLSLSPTAVARASFALRAVTVLMPLGFLLGGVVFYAGDPGLAIVLVPPTGALLVVVLVIVARAFSSSTPRGNG